jgi:hypothetical protein
MIDARERHVDEQYVQFNYTLCMWVVFFGPKHSCGKKTLMEMMDRGFTVT